MILITSLSSAGVLFHELSHWQLAKHNNLEYEIRLISFGIILLLLSLMMGLISFIQNMPPLPIPAIPCGFLIINSEKTNKKVGLCKSAGPLVNLVYGFILLVISIVIPNEMYPLNILIGITASLNFMLGLFNMLPIGILDGQYIYNYSKSMYFFLVISLLSLMIFFYANYYNFDSTIYYPSQV